ncbi:hypothetical protein C8R45DRAFT_934826 [Mycena sanguinolenta]|nr:hypothetical protein C8R45DRAFT_934826 [Mycena sanguinolenta]
MDSFTATVPTKQEDVVLPPVNEDGGGGSRGSCVVCKEDTSLPPMNEDGGALFAQPTPTSVHITRLGHQHQISAPAHNYLITFDFYTIRALMYTHTHKTIQAADFDPILTRAQALELSSSSLSIVQARVWRLNAPSQQRLGLAYGLLKIVWGTGRNGYIPQDRRKRVHIACPRAHGSIAAEICRRYQLWGKPLHVPYTRKCAPPAVEVTGESGPTCPSEPNICNTGSRQNFKPPLYNMRVLITHKDLKSAEELRFPILATSQATTLNQLGHEIVQGLQTAGREEEWELLVEEIDFYHVGVARNTKSACSYKW